MFLVGNNKTPVSVHSAVMASLSEPFNRLINGPMREAQEKCAELPDIELEIFTPLVEFDYTQDYTLKHFSYDSIESQKEDIELAEQSEQALRKEGDILILCRPNMKALTNASLKTQWREREYLSAGREFCRQYTRSAEHWSHYTKSTHEATYLLHAKLYSLGERYMIPHVKVVAVQKLHNILNHCDDVGCLNRNGQNEQISAAVSLTSYAYSNDNTPGSGADGQLDLL